MDDELLKEINKIISMCFNEPPIALYKGIDPLTRKAVYTSIALNLLYESRPHQYKLSDKGMRVVQLGSIEKYLSEIELKNKSQPTQIISHGNFVSGDNSGSLNQSFDNSENKRIKGITNYNTAQAKRKMSIVERVGIILGIIVSVIIIYQFIIG
jgi:hypothetical protein